MFDKKGKLVRSNTMTGTTNKEKEKEKEKAVKEKSGSKWGYGFGLGKKKEAEAEAAAAERNLTRGLSQRTLPVYQATSQPPTRHNSQSTQSSKRTQESGRTHRTHDSNRSKGSRSAGRAPYGPQPHGLTGYRASQDTLVQSDSIYRRKADDVASIHEVLDSTQRLEDLRKLMVKERVDI